MQSISLAEAWKEQSNNWAAWARKPGHDSYWRFHRHQFFQLLPAPGVLTADIGCGEGRVTRDLKQLGHKTISFDISESLVNLARQADPEGVYTVADAACIPLADESVDLVVSFMCLQDVDDLSGAISEMSRILKRQGCACIAIVHPLNSAGNFVSEAEDSEFIIKGSYLEEFRYSDTFERDELQMTFHSQHRPLETYSRALEEAGLLISAIREHPIGEYHNMEERSMRWRRLPLFLHLRALKMAG